ncbi:hypothetical protein [Microbacterium sp.]|uniref:hypothetical protein n=1 Tax=Microbacterium sp. TaxID=51671 RepID=UPI00281250C6|nr:hypothetical protein [Microbacterium sp.]
MTTRQLRLLRAASVSGIATLLAAVSHTIGGGAAPHALLVVALSVLLTAPAALLIGARPRRVRIAATVFASQGAFHTVFLLLGAPTGVAGIGRHHHHVDLSVLEPLASAAAPDAAMVGSHLVAAALTTTLIWHGERLLHGVAGWVRALTRRALAPTPARHEPPHALRSTLRPVHDAGLAAVASLRGPPVLARG